MHNNEAIAWNSGFSVYKIIIIIKIELQITQEPQSKTGIMLGEEVTLSVSAVGAEHYEWQKKGNVITGTDRSPININIPRFQPSRSQGINTKNNVK